MFVLPFEAWAIEDMLNVNCNAKTAKDDDDATDGDVEDANESEDSLLPSETASTSGKDGKLFASVREHIGRLYKSNDKTTRLERLDSCIPLANENNSQTFMPSAYFSHMAELVGNRWLNNLRGTFLHVVIWLVMLTFILF